MNSHFIDGAAHSDRLQSLTKIIDGINVFIKTRSPKKTREPQCCKCSTHLVLLHGWMGTLDDMDEIADGLLQPADGDILNCCTAILLDLPYHGGSANVSPADMPGAAEIVCRALSMTLSSLPATICSGTPLSLLGYSLGGRIALEMYTIQRSNETWSSALPINSLILLSSAPPPLKAQHNAIRKQTTDIATTLSSMTTVSQFKSWLRDSWYTAPMWGNLADDFRFEHILERRSRNFSLAQRSAWSKAVISLDRTTMTIAQQSQAESSIPILFVYGEDDVKYASFGPAFQTIFPSVKTVAIPNAGHNVLAQAMQTVSIEVGSFLRLSFSTSGTESSSITLEHINTTKYSLPLVSPMKVGQSILSRREGLLVSIKTNTAVTGIGDICPLKGLHTETVSSIEDELQQFSKRLRTNMRRSFCVRCVSLPDIDRFTESLSPVARCGVECALVYVFSYMSGVRTDKFIHRLLQPLILCNCKKPLHGSDVIHINGVLPRFGNSEKSCKHQSENRYLSYVLNSPFQTVKLKVGSARSVADDAQAVSEAARACTEMGKSLRLDANRAWELSEYFEFEHQLGDHASSIEFIEEPVKNGAKLHELLQRRDGKKTRGKLRIALDESLDDQSLDTVRALATYCTALVVKPAVVGGLTKISQLVNIAAKSGCTVIISSVFDSGVGLAWSALIASVCDNVVNHSYGSRMPSHGLGTFSQLTQDVYNPGFGQRCLRSDGVSVDMAQCHNFLESASQSLQPVL